MSLSETSVVNPSAFAGGRDLSVSLDSQLAIVARHFPEIIGPEIKNGIALFKKQSPQKPIYIWINPKVIGSGYYSKAIERLIQLIMYDRGVDFHNMSGFPINQLVSDKSSTYLSFKLMLVRESPSKLSVVDIHNTYDCRMGPKSFPLDLFEGLLMLLLNPSLLSDYYINNIGIICAGTKINWGGEYNSPVIYKDETGGLTMGFIPITKRSEYHNGFTGQFI